MTTDFQLFSQGKKPVGAKSSELQVNVVFSGDKYMRKLNKKFRGKDESTDVLAFSADEEIESEIRLMGEIVVNLEQAGRQAEEYGISEIEEVARLITHGALHLLGYDDKDEQGREEMEKMQERIVKEAQTHISKAEATT